MERKHFSIQCASSCTINTALSFGLEVRAKSVIHLLVPAQRTTFHFQSNKSTEEYIGNYLPNSTQYGTMRHPWWFHVAAILAAVALSSTVITLLLQAYFGRTPLLALVGQILAAIGSSGYALWLIRKRR